MARPETDRARKRPLVEGHKMRCPRCKSLQDILEFQPMLEIAEFEHDTVPIFKCISRAERGVVCGWTFAPRPSVVLSIEDMRKAIATHERLARTEAVPA